MPPLHINVIQRSARDPRKNETLFRMWQMARHHGLRTTTLLTRDFLLNPAACDRVRALWEGSSDELGVSFHDFRSPEFQELHGTPESAAWLLPRPVRTSLYDEVIGLFEKRFGFAPISAADYVMDAWSLRYLAQHHPSVKVAVTNCFEEGVNMFRGNNHNWHLMSDGGPWMPFFPSRENALAPAHSTEDAIDIVAVPHLSRDMVMALSSRDDLFASHPLNLIRARINDGSKCPYHYRALEQWVEQTAHNGWEYYNIFVSTGWLTQGHWAVPNIEEGTQLYDDTLAAFRKLQDESRAKVCTMAEFSSDFRQRARPHGAPHLCHWKDVLNPDSRREVVWVCNSHYRIALDLNIGGTIVDLRPYSGRLDGDMGPECANLQNGSHPFLISSEHRGGFWNNGQAAFLEVDGLSLPLWESNRVRAHVRRDGEALIVEADPAVVDFPGGSARIVSRWRFDRGSSIRLERDIISLEGKAPADLAISEWLSGAFGTTEYSEGLKGVLLSARTAGGSELGRLPFTYGGAQSVHAGAQTARVQIPQARVAAEFQAPAPATATLKDGWLFSPAYSILLRQSARLGVPVVTLLTLEKLP